MFERPSTGEKALLVHIDIHNTDQREGSFQEFKELVTSAGACIVATIKGTRYKPDPRFFAGSGKIQEIKESIQVHDIEIVMFNQRLSPSQERNLEIELECRVLDRTGLILDIFAQRAYTFEGKLQVELAQLVHLSTRLVRGWTHLERQKGGIGLRGPGETQLETDRRLLALRVKTIKARLNRVSKQREQGRQSRQKSRVPTISLVGYTNAGKSTLFNVLTGNEVFTADQLFATLDPTYRKLVLPGKREAVLVDTVGFISDLPHELVDAFRSTLLETREADLLLHVIDTSDDLRDQRIKDVHNVLKEIDADQVQTLLVYNKIDKCSVSPHIVHNANAKPVEAWVSAHSGEGLEELNLAIRELIDTERVRGCLTLPVGAGDIRAKLHALGAIIAEEFSENGAFELEVDVDKTNWRRLCQKYGLREDVISTAA